MRRATPVRSRLLISTLLVFLASGTTSSAASPQSHSTLRQNVEEAALQDKPLTLSTNTFAEIIGGELAPKPYPTFGRWDRGCVVSLVAPDIVLTAAHGGSLVNHRNVYLGSVEASGGVKRTLIQAIPHPN